MIEKKTSLGINVVDQFSIYTTRPPVDVIFSIAYQDPTVRADRFDVVKAMIAFDLAVRDISDLEVFESARRNCNENPAFELGEHRVTVLTVLDGFALQELLCKHRVSSHSESLVKKPVTRGAKTFFAGALPGCATPRAMRRGGI